MIIYRTSEGPYTQKDFEVRRSFPHPIVKEFTTFKHCNLPVMGVGPKGLENKIFYLDRFINLSGLTELNAEILNGIANKCVDFNKVSENGILLSSVNQQKSLDSYIYHIDKYEKNKNWIQDIQNLSRKGDIKFFLNSYFNLRPYLDGIAMFRNYKAEYVQKAQPSEWLGIIEHFPLLKSFVEKLPFKYVGYVMLLKSPPQGPVIVHRDHYPTNHRVNFINFRLNQKARPFFMYDCFTGEKTYMRPESKCFFFNETDAHGIDAESESQLTLRVEGQFTDAFKNEIGLGEDDIFNWDFEHVRQFLKTGKFKIEQDTDI